jgi:hypothetical protein
MDEDLRKKIASLLVDLSLGKISITKTNYELMALIASYGREARIDELEMAISIKGKTYVDGMMLDTSNFEGGQPNLIDSGALEARLKAMKNLKEPTHE